MEFEKKTLDAALNITDEVSVMTRGCSMRPLFKEHRDIVNIKKKFRDVKRGDVIAYPNKNKTQFILHRILKVSGDNLIIRGDNNFFLEKRKISDVVGIMTSFIRNGKYVDCQKSFKYKIYSFYILNSYPLRYLYHKRFRPFLSKIKHFFFK